MKVKPTGIPQIGSSTDNAVVRWNGTGGATVQNSGITVDDSNNVTGLGNISLGANSLKFTNHLIRQQDATQIYLRNIADTAFTILQAGGIIVGTAAGEINIASTGAIRVATTNAGYVDFKARITDGANVVIGRLQGAADPYFAFGGSQEFKFYNSGAVDFNNLTGILRADSGSVSVDADVTAEVAAASTTVAGKIEVAIASEVNTGTSAALAVSPDALAGSVYGYKPVFVKLIDDATALAIGDGKFIFVVPAMLNGWNLVGVEAHVTTVSSSGTPTYSLVNLTSTADMLSTDITIDINEYTSATAATPAVINGAEDDLATGDRIEINKDVQGTGEKGDEVLLIFQLP